MSILSKDSFNPDALQLKNLLESNNLSSLNQFLEDHDISFLFETRFDDKQLSSKNLLINLF